MKKIFLISVVTISFLFLTSCTDNDLEKLVTEESTASEEVTKEKSINEETFSAFTDPEDDGTTGSGPRETGRIK